VISCRKFPNQVGGIKPALGVTVKTSPLRTGAVELGRKNAPGVGFLNCGNGLEKQIQFRFDHPRARKTKKTTSKRQYTEEELYKQTQNGFYEKRKKKD